MAVSGRALGVALITLAGAACSSFFARGESPDAEELDAQLRDDLRVEATLVVDTVAGRAEVRPAISATNAGSQAIHALSGQFPWWWRAYSSSSRNGSPIWRMEEWITAVVHIGRPLDIPAGGTVLFGEDWIPPMPVDDIRGSDPPAVYYFTVELKVHLPSGGPLLRSVEYPAGQAYLPGPGHR
jgi:hypothetical protein